MLTHLILYVFVFAIVMVQFVANHAQAQKPDIPECAGELNVRYCKLRADDREVADTALKTAKALYVQGKYEHCLEQLDSAERIAGTFRDSGEIRTLCLQGAELVFRASELERRDREQQRTRGSKKSN